VHVDTVRYWRGRYPDDGLPTLAPGAARTMRVNHEYDRGGTLAYLAAYDVHRAQVFSHCAAKTGIVPFMTLAEPVMTQEPYASAKRVFWVVDLEDLMARIERHEQTKPNPPTASWLRTPAGRTGPSRITLEGLTERTTLPAHPLTYSWRTTSLASIRRWQSANCRIKVCQGMTQNRPNGEPIRKVVRLRSRWSEEPFGRVTVARRASSVSHPGTRRDRSQ
jgi:hypothetical protein